MPVVPVGLPGDGRSVLLLLLQLQLILILPTLPYPTLSSTLPYPTLLYPTATGDARAVSGMVVVGKGRILCMYGGCEMVGRALPYPPPPPPPLPHSQLLINVIPHHLSLIHI